MQTSQILNLATSLHAVADAVAAFAGEEKPAEEVDSGVTIAEVRKILADKAQAGKQDQVKALIASFGADKLTDIDPEHYPAIKTQGEAL